MLKGIIAKILFLTTFLSIVCISPTTASAQKRIALVIGNSNYTQSSPLPNPVNDANLMARTLEAAGFEVTKLLDADLRTMKKALIKFGRTLRKKTEAGLFYYAGHGIQVGGENFLIPVNASIADEDEIELEGIKLNSFLRVMRSSAASVNIVVLDACRNNPFARSFRSASRGLAPVDAPKGTYIAYATAPGDVAADGDGDNSPYTKALAAAMSVRGIAIENVFKQARKSVLDETNNLQVPWETTSITGDFYFHKSEKTPKPISTPTVATNDAEKFYSQIKDTNSIEILKTFAAKFPKSFYTTLVNVRIGELERKQAALEATKRKTIANPGETNRFAKLKKADASWKLLKGSNDVKALTKFVEEFSDTAFAALATGRIELLAAKTAAKAASIASSTQLNDENTPAAAAQWAALENSENITALRNFITRFPNTPQANKAGKRIEDVEVARNQIAFSRWKQLENSTSQFALKRFIQQFPTSGFSRLATDRLKKLQSTSIVTALENEAAYEWERISSSTSIYALQKFATKFPSTNYAGLANKRIVMLRDNNKSPTAFARLERDAQLRWTKLYNSKSIPELQIFASKYSSTSFASFAQSRIFSLKSGNKPTRTIKKVGSTKRVKLATIGRWHSFHYDTNGENPVTPQQHPPMER